MNGAGASRQAGVRPCPPVAGRAASAGPRAPPGPREAAESHLLRALDGELDDREAAHALLGELYLADEAVRRGGVAPDQGGEGEAPAAHPAGPAVRPPRRQGPRPRRGGAGGQLLPRPRPRPTWTTSAHGWAGPTRTAFLEDFPAAVAILQEGLNVSDEPVYRTALGGVYFVWADVAGPRSERQSPATGWRWWRRASATTPRTSGCSTACWPPSRSAVPRRTRRERPCKTLLASGKAPASVHFALGLDALQRGKAEEARLHLERANELAPRTPAIANNLAWVLATSEPAGPAPRPGSEQPGRGPIAERPFLPRHPRPRPDEAGPLERGPGRPGSSLGRQSG